jgi:FKBP-type peptidyl-prolyl cis-trans isomerase 2
MALKKGDFIEIEFVGKVKDGNVFDSNTKDGLEKMGTKGNPKPFVFSLGHGMFLKGIDEFLVGKEIGEYDILVKPEDAFGKRDPNLIQRIPVKNFVEHGLNPIPGSVFNFDGRLAKVLTVSGGRVMIDFNNPVAGKDLDYKIKVVRLVQEDKEKINALNDFFFRKELDFEVKDKKIEMKFPLELKQFGELFKDKYKEILGMDLVVLDSKVEEKK